jgi:hypothetical protein
LTISILKGQETGKVRNGAPKAGSALGARRHGYAGTRESMVCGGCGARSKHAKISFVGTNGSGLSISRVSCDFSNELELISDFERNNVGINGKPGGRVQQ